MADAHEATSSNPESVLFARHAAKLAEAEEYDQAITVLNEGIGHHPSYAAGYQVLGEIHARRGENGQAMDMFERALALDPQNPRLLFRLGSLCLDEEPGRAQDLLWRARRYEPDVAELEDAFARSIAGPGAEGGEPPAGNGSVVVIDAGGGMAFMDEPEPAATDEDAAMTSLDTAGMDMDAPDEELPEKALRDEIPAEVAEAFAGPAASTDDDLDLSVVTEQALTDLQTGYDTASHPRPLDDRDALDELVRAPGQNESDDVDSELDDILAGFDSEAEDLHDLNGGGTDTHQASAMAVTEDTTGIQLSAGDMENIEPYPPEPDEPLVEDIDETIELSVEMAESADGGEAFDSDRAFPAGETGGAVPAQSPDRPADMDAPDEEPVVDLMADTGKLPAGAGADMADTGELAILEDTGLADTGNVPASDDGMSEYPGAAIADLSGKSVTLDDEDDSDTPDVDLSALFGGEIPNEDEAGDLDTIGESAALDIDDALTVSYDALLEELEQTDDDVRPAIDDTTPIGQMREAEPSGAASAADATANTGEFIIDTGEDIADALDMVDTGDYVLPGEIEAELSETAPAPDLSGEHEEAREETDRDVPGAAISADFDGETPGGAGEPEFDMVRPDMDDDEVAASSDSAADEMERTPETGTTDNPVAKETISTRPDNHEIERLTAAYAGTGEPAWEATSDEPDTVDEEPMETDTVSGPAATDDVMETLSGISDESMDTGMPTEEEAIAAYSKLLRDIDLSGIETDDNDRGILEFGEEELSALTFDETTPDTLDEPVLSEEERAELSTLESITDDTGTDEPAAGLGYEDILGGMTVRGEAASDGERPASGTAHVTADSADAGMDAEVTYDELITASFAGNDPDTTPDASGETESIDLEGMLVGDAENMDESGDTDGSGSAETGRIVEEMMRGSMNIRLTPSDRDIESVEQSSLDSLINEYVNTLGALSRPATPASQSTTPPSPALPRTPPATSPSPAADAGTMSTDDAEDTQDEATATMAEIYVRQGLIARAIDIYTRIAKKQPDNQSVRNRLETLTHLSTNMSGEE